MGYLSQTSLSLLGFKSIGNNNQLSEKAVLYRTNDIEIGSNCRIDDFCILTGKIRIGDNCHIAANTIISGGRQAPVIIEDNVTLAYGCTIISRSNDYLGIYPPGVNAIENNELELESTTFIEEHSLLGMRSSVLPGVRIRRGTAIGAHSLLTKSTLEWSIYVGVPAKRVKERSKSFLVNL